MPHVREFVAARRSRARSVALVLVAATSTLAANASLSQEASPGRRQFLNACGVCHAAEPDAAPRQGPNLFGVFGRPAAQASGFKYSEALKTSGFVWDEATLDTWLTDAQGARPGVVMLYRQANPERRQLVIDYLKTLK
ncbi:MAG: c-type cytochrome [Hyphomicrobiaceae bacterium]